MKISLKTEGKKFFIIFPNWLFLNSLALKIAKKLPGADTIPDIPPRTIRRLKKTLRQMHKIHPNWKLVDIKSADGTGAEVVI